ncbi:hypothetical protein K2173_013000 [Erythroxylum novogranatense]|uniref:Disease resistance protein RGA3 n=1 Tax=Erythroxylum novogranatense TaxID=1862640 RepID=A0AAV8S731_9ROSI|nr:hypothetical protein K2173_013000 [Erythroxylum novogranatense]
MVLSSMTEEVKLVSGVNDEVKKLVSIFKSIQALLDDAEEQQVKEVSVRNWLFNLKAVSYDMDDVLDEWKTWIQTSQLQHEPDPLKNKVLSFFRCNCFTTSDVGLRHVVGGRIREIKQRLDDIATDRVRYQLNSTDRSEKHVERYVTTSFIDTQEVKGREEEKDRVKSKIFSGASKLHIISLVGMGGIGKTTLAKLIYNDNDIQDHFEEKIWVCVSEPFDEMRIAKAILESLRGSSTHDFRELENILKEIRAILYKKRFLLVLDDVWNENPNKWKELKHSLTCGLLGSTILITTRKERVALLMGCNNESIHKIGFLNSEQCWSIIRQIAFVNGERDKLERIGKKIADKCKGLPLAATTLGGLLRFKKSMKEWSRVLESEGWESDDLLGPLKLSYYDLPLPLKQCFSYCSIFPKDSKIGKRELIGMWMAQGYLKGKEEDEDLEIIGETYFENLIARSLLQTLPKNRDTCMLHDMVSDLAQTFTKNECLIMEVLNDTDTIQNSLCAEVRHLTLALAQDVSVPVSVYDLNKLRTLIIRLFEIKSPSVVVLPLESVFYRLTRLRILDLHKCGIKEVPSSISKLVHLRWLDLSENYSLQKLPETLCDCYNLQTLTLVYCVNLEELPQGIGRLSNLMYLDMEGCRKIKYLPKGIGNLWRLKKLSDFILGVHENEASVADLEKLNNLRGTLSIRGLGNVRKIEETKAIQLKKKKNINRLKLNFHFDGDFRLEDEEELLETLEPHLDLEMLRIQKYNGKTMFPSWMMKLNLLRELWISICENLQELPPLGKLPFLEELYIGYMRVKRVGIEFMGIEEEDSPMVAFPKLKKLVFSELSEWEEWDDGWLTERIKKKITVMPYLRELSIWGCPRLNTLPYHLLSPTITNLERLNIKECCVLQQRIEEHKLSHIPQVIFKARRYLLKKR